MSCTKQPLTIAMLCFSITLLTFPTQAQTNYGKTTTVVNREKIISSLLGAHRAAGASAEPRIAKTKAGHVRFLSFGSPTGYRTRAISSDPETIARSFLNQHGLLFGSNSALSAQKIIKVKTVGERSYVRFSQTLAGLPVLAAETIIQTAPNGGVVCVVSDIMRETAPVDKGVLSLDPSVAADQASEAAIDILSPEYPMAKLISSTPELMIFAPEVLGLTGRARLVWKTIVTNERSPLPQEAVFIDARSGELAFRYPLVHAALNREIYDRDNVPGYEDEWGDLVRAESDPPVANNPEANLAYDNFGDTYDFYMQHHGRDSIDDNGFTLSATVRFVPDGETAPYDNAFWDPNEQRMYFGDGLAAADDVVGHELTHGVTDNESALIYYGESGAINESFSDIWGEFVDLTNGFGTDTEAVRWQMGEDLPASIGVVRDMADPTTLDDPDRVNSPYFYTGTADYGGVHSNCGVSNKLCYLLTDGDTFNGYTVVGIGLDLTADLFYECQTNLLPAGADFRDLYDLVWQAANNLGFTQEQLDDVDAASLAVEIDLVYNPEDYYDITYKDKRDSSLNYKTSAGIIIIDGVGFGTLKIKRKKGFSFYPPIRAVEIAGSLNKLYTEGDIGDLVLGGTLQSLTAKNAFVKLIDADVVGAVKMKAYAQSSITAGAETFYTSIYGALAPKGSLMDLKVTLTGVSLLETSAPKQTASYKLASIKWKNPDGEKDVSLSHIPYEGNNMIEAADIRLLSVKGGGPWYVSDSAGGILPYWINALDSTNTSSKIKGSGVQFSITDSGVGYKETYNGSVWPDYLDSGAKELSVLSAGGDIKAYEIIAGQDIKKLEAKYKKYRIPGKWFYEGGQMGQLVDFVEDYNIFVAGFDGNASRADIRSVYGAVGVAGKFAAGAYRDTQGDLVAEYTGTVAKIATKKPSSYPEDPIIEGVGWSRHPIKFKGGDHGWFEENYPNSLRFRDNGNDIRVISK